MKTGLIILGAQKCATTTMYHLLRAHPQMCASKQKETNFFSEVVDWRADIHIYEQQFEHCRGQIRFEASPSYTYFPHKNLRIWEDMFAYNPDLKFIYLVRNPLDRIVSAYMHSFQRGFTDAPIDDAVFRRPGLLAVSRYYTQIIPFIRTFGRERVLIIDFDDFMLSQRATMDSVADFIGIDASLFNEQEDVHMNPSLNVSRTHHKWDNQLLLKPVRKYFPKLWRRVIPKNTRTFAQKPVLSTDRKKAIIDVLDYEIDQLEKLMGKSLQHWKTVEHEKHPEL
ncbi:MAG TPA: sulfotransferase [Saprospiraceae bacterium]|nr:sulfotransferase [Saprospiraceae bacterium]